MVAAASLPLLGKGLELLALSLAGC